MVLNKHFQHQTGLIILCVLLPLLNLAQETGTNVDDTNRKSLCSKIAHCDQSNLPLPKDDIPVVYRLFSSGNPSGTIITSASQIPTGHLYVVTHGFVSGLTETFLQLVQALLNRHPTSLVLFIDWSDASGSWSSPAYARAVSNMYEVAKMAASFFRSGVSLYPVSTTHCIGHSLGAHLCGMISAELGERWARLTALDPAGPCFSLASKLRRVNNLQGQYVDVIHTDPKCLGINLNIGDSDFWPNDSPSFQPGCSPSVDFGCSHSRALTFFIESINPPLGQCFPTCSTKQGPCLPADGSKMGFFSDSNTKRGVFYGKFPLSNRPFSVCEPQFCNPEKKVSELPSCDRYFLLVLDTSGSMYGKRIEKLKKAAIQFVDMADDWMTVGLVTFNSNAQVVIQPQLLLDNGRRDLRTKINYLDVFGATCIACGVRAGIDALASLGRLGGHIILLTDGEDTEDKNAWLSKALGYVEKQKARIHTIALGGAADAKLEQLAEATYGERDFVAEDGDLSNFIKVFSTILQNEASGDGVKHVTLMSTSVNVQPKVPVEVPILLDSSLGEDTLITSIYDRNLSPMAGAMVPPTKKVAKQPEVGEIPCEDDSDFNKLYCKIHFKPEPGVWALRMSSSSTKSGQASVTVTASAVVNETVQNDTITVKSQVTKKTIASNDPNPEANVQLITASLGHGDYALLAANVNATIQSEKGQLWTITLLDNGQGHDWQTNDGVYTGTFKETSTPGRYSISIFASGGANEAFYMPQIKLGYLPGNCLDVSKTSARQYVTFERVISGATFNSVKAVVGVSEELLDGANGTAAKPEKPPGYGKEPSTCSNAAITFLFCLHFRLLLILAVSMAIP